MKGFTFGKFLPFHKGHEAMIRFGLNNSEQFTVIICCSNKEGIAGTVRKQWLEGSIGVHPALEVLVLDYDESELPNSSKSSMDISRIWSDVFTKILPDHTMLVTSEPYGDMVAGCMGIQHMPFDMEKKFFPVSASYIRQDIQHYWNFLPDIVKRYFAIKVVINGTESTGKTTLSENLAAHYNCSLVAEAGRDIITDSTDFKYDDLYLVANEHARRIYAASFGQSPLIIIDTDIHITMSYAEFIFGKPLQISYETYAINKADLYFYLDKDVAFEQDGTRLDEKERNKLDAAHRQVLNAHKIEVVNISGNWDERFLKTTSLINSLLAQRYDLCKLV